MPNENAVIPAERTALTNESFSSISSEFRPASQPVPVTPMQLLMRAMDSGADLDRLERLMAMHNAWQAEQARMAFADAMAAFKLNPPQIVKDMHVQYDTSKGRTEYQHASLGNVCGAIVKALSEHGISHRWELDQSNGRITVTCVLTHVQGHNERTVLSSAPDDSGGKNSIQAIASAVTYLQRYTLLAATGTATNEADDDGRDADPVERITESQAADLQAKAEELGVNIVNFKKFLKVENFSDLPAAQYKKAIQVLDDRAKGKKQ